MSLEQEAKFILTDPGACRDTIISLGGVSRGRVFETNICYDDRKRRLAASQSILRLRRDKIVRLTFKSPLAGEPDTQVKTMHELETTVTDFDTMDQILTAIGFAPAQIYEKWRETFTLDGAELCLDTMPFGNFLEIESSPAQVKSLSAALGFRWEKRVLANYLAIFALIRKKEGFDFTDITFAHFKPLAIDLEQYAPLLEAGSCDPPD